jgi:hypothetical protein
MERSSIGHVVVRRDDCKRSLDALTELPVPMSVRLAVTNGALELSVWDARVRCWTIVRIPAEIVFPAGSDLAVTVPRLVLQETIEYSQLATDPLCEVTLTHGLAVSVSGSTVVAAADRLPPPPPVAVPLTRSDLLPAPEPNHSSPLTTAGDGARLVTLSTSLADLLRARAISEIFLVDEGPVRWIVGRRAGFQPVDVVGIDESSIPLAVLAGDELPARGPTRSCRSHSRRATTPTRWSR